MMEEIGGFFEFPLKSSGEYHENAIKLNSGRNALAFILKTKPVRKIYLPRYCCNALLEPLIAKNVAYEFYPIDQSFKPLISKDLSPDEYFLYINYFGICDTTVRSVADRFDNVIIDNSQAFFSSPVEGVDTFYSPRKFFGVADGGYLYTDSGEGIGPVEEDLSYERYLYLLKRTDTTAQDAYPLFLENESAISALSLRSMSRLTRSILSSIDYGWARERRDANYRILQQHLGALNELPLDGCNISGPHVYPLLIKSEGLREYLISKKVYVATYWKDVLKRTEPASIEHYFSNCLIPLPVDQRYDGSHMARICEVILEYLNKEKEAKYNEHQR